MSMTSGPIVPWRTGEIPALVADRKLVPYRRRHDCPLLLAVAMDQAPCRLGLPSEADRRSVFAATQQVHRAGVRQNGMNSAWPAPSSGRGRVSLPLDRRCGRGFRPGRGPPGPRRCRARRSGRSARRAAAGPPCRASGPRFGEGAHRRFDGRRPTSRRRPRSAGSSAGEQRAGRRRRAAPRRPRRGRAAARRR